MLKMMLQSMKYRKFKNILLVLQFTIGFAALLFGLGSVNNVLQYKKNVEGLAALDTVHISILEGDETMEDPVTMLPEYRNAFLQVQERDLTERMGFFELMHLYENPKDRERQTFLYALNEDGIAMSKLSMQEGSVEPLKNYNREEAQIPVVVSADLEKQYSMGKTYVLSYVSGKTYEYEEISIEVVGVLEPSVRFWCGGSTELSSNITGNKDFLLAPQFMDFTEELTYSMNSLLQLSGTESEKEKKLEEIQAIFENNQLGIQHKTLQKEVDSYYERQKVVVIGTLTFAGILLLLSLLGCIGAILAGVTTRYREFGIYYSLGFTKRNMVCLVQGEIMALFVFSFLAATGISKVFFEYAISESGISIDAPVIFTAFMMMLVCMILCGTMPFLKLRKIEPIGMIKGENR